MKRFNPKRRAKSWQRSYHSEERVEWIQTLACVGCGALPSLNCHSETGGVGMKAPYLTIYPGCADCHSLEHTQGRETMQWVLGVNLVNAAALTQRLWALVDTGTVSKEFATNTWNLAMKVKHERE